MKYEYSQTNRLESPCFYMYTKYYGKEFLEAYFSNRIAIINNYNIKEEDYLAKIYEESRQSLKYFSRNKDSTSYQLICLLIDMIESDKNKNIYDLLSIYIKKYEVSKKLYQQYDNNFKPIGTQWKNIDHYILLFIACGVYFLQSDNLKFLNCQLKLGDLIISIDNKLETPKFKEFALIGISIEMNSVNKLLVKHGLEL